MPDVSIAIAAKDNFSSTLRAMGNNTKVFSKEMDLLQSKLDQIGRTKASLTVDVSDAKRALREAQKEYQNLSADASEADKAAARAKFEAAQSNLDNLQASVKALGNAYRETTNEMTSLAGTSEKVASEGTLGASSPWLTSTKIAQGDILGGFAKNLMGAGIINTLGAAFGQYGEYMAMSGMGKTDATMLESVLSSATSGAAAGMVAGPWGALAGAGIGALAGGITGYTQIQTEKDEAFKSYVQSSVETVLADDKAKLESGSAIAASRETDLISFTTLLGSEENANQFLNDTREMAKNTPFYYDDLTAMSKQLMTFGYGMEEILPALTAVGDAGAALGLGVADMETVAKVIGRMRSTDKVTQELLGMLTERGIGALQWIADEYGMSTQDVYTNMSKGKFDGSEIADLLLNKITEKFGNSMYLQSQTFSGKASTLEGMQQEIEAAYGEGYNNQRLVGMQAEIDSLDGELGRKMQESYRALGAWKAELENIREEYIRNAKLEAMETDEYKTAEREGNAAEMGRIIMAAQIRGQNEYLSHEGKDQELQMQLDLIKSVQEDKSVLGAYETAGYAIGNALTKGIQNCLHENLPDVVMGEAVAGIGAWGDGFTKVYDSPTDDRYGMAVEGYGAYGDIDGSHASGLQRVPYNNYLALLHEGERVLTAREARDGRADTPVRIMVNGLSVREEADIDKIAWALYDRMRVQALAAAP